MWRSCQDRWGLQSLPLPTFICSAHPCLWESACCRLTHGLSISPFTQSLKFPLLWYVGLLWSYCEPAEVIGVAYSEVNHCCSAVALLFRNIVCVCEQPGEDKWLPRIQPPTLNERCYIMPTITHWDAVWPVSTGLHISKCSQMYEVCLLNDLECLRFVFNTMLFFTFSYLFCFYLV